MRYIGNIDLLNLNSLGIFCSQEIDLAIYYDMVDFVKVLSALPLAFASGWQSNIEKRVLRDLQDCKIIYFLAKDITLFKPSTPIQKILNQQRALILTNTVGMNRVTNQSVKKRDDYILSVINKILILNMSESGHLEKFVINSLQQFKRVFILDHFSNYEWFKKYPSLIPISKSNIEDLI